MFAVSNPDAGYVYTVLARNLGLSRIIILLVPLRDVM